MKAGSEPEGVEGDTERAFCDLCKTSFSIGHGGEYDVKRHRLTETHKKRVQQKETSKSMDAFLRPKNDFLADKVTAAEVTSVYHTVQHATSYRAGDCGTKLAPTIYPDSDIAKRMACAHTPFFSVASDASNHGTTKLFPLSVRYWTPDLGVQTKVLDFYDDSDETSAAIHNQIVTKLEENGLGLDMISAQTVWPTSFTTVQNTQKKIDIENVVNKTFSHFSSSAKRIEELKSIHTFVEIEYQSLLRHVPTRWLSLWPAVKRLHDSWAPIKTYFLSLGEDQCPKSLWQLFKDDQDGEGNPLDLQVYLSFLSNALKIFHNTVLVLEREDGTVCELYDMMFTLKTKLQQRQSDGFFGAQTGVLLQQFPDRQAAVLREDMCNFYQSSLTYLEQRYDFSDSNYQKKVASLALKKSPFNFSHLCEAVEVLQLSKKLDMDALYDEYCVVLPHQQAIVQTGATVVEKWATLLKHTHTHQT
ncbi:uncharacterized protein LOC131543068 [Onychostoma macrolepis]|uniref:uncharacterized protein LOC131543068 n=1 Tax=Onychostoma macrolepis TaxID=369639 RepID=UPI00272AE4A5|nr:uncharacterized protein LOC131543068 [Onychostoma macrolepis]